MDSEENGHHKEMASIYYGMDKQDAKTGKTDKTFICEIVTLIVTLLLAWMLLLLPIIFYHLPDEVYSSKMPELTTSDSTTECSATIPYPENGVCQSVLEGTLLSMNCDPGESLSVLRDTENNARLLFFALNQGNPSPECIAAAAPLLCLHLFGLCDSSGVSIQPSSGQCRNVRDWLGLDLPDCDIFPEEEASCPGSDLGSGSINSSGAAPLSTRSPGIPSCREDFLFSEEDNICVANCHTWSEFTPSVAVSTDVITILSAIIGFITGVAVIVISLLRFKKVFVFPSIFIVYMTCDVLVIGMAFIYIVLQLALWWLFHTTALLWKVGFPLHARSFDKSGKTKYIHIACVIVGVVVPLIPVIALMANFASEVGSTAAFASGGLGFTMGRFPPVLCSGGDSVVTYYSVLLPINLIFFPGITELILLFAVVHKQQWTLYSEEIKNLELQIWHT